MFATTLPDRPVSAASQNEFARPAERTFAHERIAPPTPVDTSAKSQNQQTPPNEKASSGTSFAAAILAGALPPRPETLNQLYARIGISSIPEGSQSRLRDLQV